MPTVIEIIIHPTTPRHKKRQYQFTPKHHGGDPGAACWLVELTFDEEFSVFDDADYGESCDDDGNLYGVKKTDEGGLRYLGTWNQQVAEFPVARDGEPWHGYPLWPLNQLAPENRRGEKMRPDKIVFDRLRRANLISKQQRKRLMKGDEV